MLLWHYYTSVVQSDSKVTFLREGRLQSLFPFFYCFVYRMHCIFGEAYCQIFLSSIPQKVCSFSGGGGSIVSTSENCSSLMSNWPLKIYFIGLSFTSSRFLKCSFHFSSISSWLTAFSFDVPLLFLLLIMTIFFRISSFLILSWMFFIYSIWYELVLCGLS